MISTAVFDLETSDLNADSGIILCAVIQSSTRKTPIVIRTDDTNPNWKKGLRGDDSATVKKVQEALADHDVLCAHNGTRFDLPFLRTRALKWGIPRLPDIKVVDPLSIAWRKFRLKSNRLGNLSDYVGVKDKKTPLDMSLWMEAVLNGSREAMDAIVEHCVADVKVLAGVLKFVKPFIRVLDERGSAL
jgi:uncharacterized protein YprB with RNaseH-like and TPR domain